MHKVKCFYCNESFDADKEDFKKVNARRYAHLSCYNKNYKTDDDYISVIYNYVKNKYGENYNYTSIERQRKLFVSKGMTNEGIYNSLKYWFEIKENSIEKSEGRIGIVPHVYDEAQAYYKKIAINEDKLQNAIETIQTKTMIDISKLENKAKKKNKEIDINSLI